MGQNRREAATQSHRDFKVCISFLCENAGRRTAKSQPGCKLYASMICSPVFLRKSTENGGEQSLPLAILATAKISKNCQPLRAFPLGGRCRAIARRMRGATDSREMILNGNETAPLFENFLQGKCNRPSPPPFGGASPRGEALT